MKNINTWEGLELQIMNDVADVLSQSDKLKYQDDDSPTYVLIHALDTEFYQLYKPKVYDPHPPFVTRDAIKSEIQKVGTNVLMQIFHDINYMRKFVGDDTGGDLKRYVNYNQKVVVEEIPDMIENGRIYPNPGYGYTEQARKNLDERNQLYDFIVKRLKELGYKIV